MRVRMFRTVFLVDLGSGRKRQTIRPNPKRIPKVGDCESWRIWKGRPYHSKQMEVAQVELTHVLPINIEPNGELILDGKTAGNLTREEVASKDGFPSYSALLSHFLKHRSLPLRGILIRAKDL
jgi:hypothetical protein